MADLILCQEAQGIFRAVKNRAARGASPPTPTRPPSLREMLPSLRSLGYVEGSFQRRERVAADDRDEVVLRLFFSCPVSAKAG